MREQEVSDAPRATECAAEFHPRLWRRNLFVTPWGAALAVAVFICIVVGRADSYEAAWSALVGIAGWQWAVVLLCGMVLGLLFAGLSQRYRGIRVTDTEIVELHFPEWRSGSKPSRGIPLARLDRAWSAERGLLARLLGYQVLVTVRAEGLTVWRRTFSREDVQGLLDMLGMDKNPISHDARVEFSPAFARWLTASVAWSSFVTLVLVGVPLLIPGALEKTYLLPYWFFVSYWGLVLILAWVRVILGNRDGFRTHAARTSIWVTTTDVSGLGRPFLGGFDEVVTIPLDELDRFSSMRRSWRDRLMGRHMLWSERGDRIVIYRREMAKDDVDRLLGMLALA